MSIEPFFGVVYTLRVVYFQFDPFYNPLTVYRQVLKLPLEVFLMADRRVTLLEREFEELVERVKILEKYVEDQKEAKCETPPVTSEF